MRLARFDVVAPTKAQRRAFDCGVVGLNEWLAQQARQSMASRHAVTYLLLDGQDDRSAIAGYFCIAAGSVMRSEVPEAFARRAPDPIPAIRIGRFAIDRDHQGKGWGGQLLQQAVLGASSASELLGARLLLVDAMNDDASAFYRRFDFVASPIHLYQLLFDLRSIASA